jgi:predicted DNA-binding transcriptional regulator AlpA
MTTVTTLPNRYTNGQAAKLLGTTKETLYRWEKRKKAGDPRYADFPAPARVVHSNHRYYTDERIEQIRAWMNRTTEAA